MLEPFEVSLQSATDAEQCPACGADNAAPIPAGCACLCKGWGCHSQSGVRVDYTVTRVNTKKKT